MLHGPFCLNILYRLGSRPIIILVILLLKELIIFSIHSGKRFFLHLLDLRNSCSDNVIYTPIWCNNNLKFNNEDMFIHRWFNKGVLFIDDFLDEDSNIINLETFNRKFNIGMPFTLFYSITTKISPLHFLPSRTPLPLPYFLPQVTPPPRPYFCLLCLFGYPLHFCHQEPPVFFSLKYPPSSLEGGGGHKLNGIAQWTRQSKKKDRVYLCKQTCIAHVMHVACELVYPIFWMDFHPIFCGWLNHPLK